MQRAKKSQRVLKKNKVRKFAITNIKTDKVTVTLKNCEYCQSKRQISGKNKELRNRSAQTELAMQTGGKIQTC